LEDWDPSTEYAVRAAVLRRGDVIAVTTILDGMCEGVNLSTGGTGVFPRHLVSFVKKVVPKNMNKAPSTPALDETSPEEAQALATARRRARMSEAQRAQVN
jgi:hypothetical protein